MDWNEAIALLHGANWKHTKIGLERMRDFMHALGDPQENLHYVHIAGTNGKGSACVMTQSILTAAGFRTGLYISPHLDQFNERISIDGETISDADLRRLAARVRAAAETLGEEPTDFEMITAMAFCYFEEQHCDLVVLEVGMGGRLDATNVISHPEVCAIMHIGLDHTEFLGDTVEKVTAEKAGILKPGADCVLYHQLPGVMAVVQKRFADVNPDAAGTTDAAASTRSADTSDSRCASGAAGTTDGAFDMAHSNHTGASTKSAAARLVITDPTAFTARARTIDGQVFDYRNRPELRIQLLGNYQMENAMAVLDIIDCLQRRGFGISENAFCEGASAVHMPEGEQKPDACDDAIPEEVSVQAYKDVQQPGISEAAIRAGLAQAVWPGRFEVLSREPLLIVDGAHNPNGVEALVNTIRAYFPDQKINFVMGVMKDKDYHTMLRLIAPFAARFITELPDAHRALRPEALKSEIRTYFDGPVETADSVTAAVQRAMEIAGDSRGTCCTGDGTVRSEIGIADDNIDELHMNRQPITICFGSLYQVAEIRNYFIRSDRSASHV